MNTDTHLFLDINAFARATPWLHGIVWVYANYGIVLFAALMLVGWWIARGRANPTMMAAALWAPLGMLLALGVNQPISAMVGEPRPYTTLGNVLVLAHRSHDPSFPSDHAVMAGAVAAALFLVSRRLGWLAALAAVVMAFSRVYIAAHYPQDVAAGLAVGAVVSLLGFWLVRQMLVWLVQFAERTPLRLVLTTAPPPTAPTPAEPMAS
ncbi:phosphatase PAP2 family protein [Amycolatopsis echigonensis]|uniref:Phosphatase PAP2 family protein n=1 Tax=Amycolatopsis echigonensis TaxID=2576905 RepID=A0A8E2B882_9PSEU|nr:phosphatase PAP2 family protein [Amycolatopsis echigonensis]MBB2504047.1 phosphatase PAP2 family protein [Amycolatopsis echigonensis]